MRRHRYHLQPVHLGGNRFGCQFFCLAVAHDTPVESVLPGWQAMFRYIAPHFFQSGAVLLQAGICLHFLSQSVNIRGRLGTDQRVNFFKQRVVFEYHEEMTENIHVPGRNGGVGRQPPGLYDSRVTFPFSIIPMPCIVNPGGS